MKIQFSASLTKVEKSEGKLPKALLEVHSTSNEITASNIAASLMAMTGGVIVTIEPAQSSIDDDEDDEPCEGQTAIPLAMHDGALLNKESGELIQLVPAEEPTTLYDIAPDAEPIPSVPEPTAYEHEEAERESESLLASSSDALMDDAGAGEDDDIPFLPTPDEIAEEEAEVASGFSMEMPPVASEVASPASAASFARLYPTRADLMITKAQRGEVYTSKEGGVRFNAYIKDSLLTLEIEDTSPDAGVDAKTFFDHAGLDFTSRMDAGGTTMIFTATK